MKSKDIKLKLSRFEHEIKHLKKNEEYDLSELMDINNIENNISNLKDPYGREHVKLKKINIDESFPEYVYKNQDDLIDFIV